MLGIDFTSRPTRRKPLTCVHATIGETFLRAHAVEEWTDFTGFEHALLRPGPWISGLDFPFGLSRRFIETIGWPDTWEAYVSYAASLGRDAFRCALTSYKEARSMGDKEHRRATDKVANSISPQKLYGVPVGLMFFEGAPRLLRSGVAIPHLKDGDPSRVVVEAYPGVLARELIGRRSYKNDTRSKQTPALAEARRQLLQQLHARCACLFGFEIEVAPTIDLVDDPGADRLDALLCAVQAAWAWTRRDSCYGKGEHFDPLEGWIAHPF